MRPSNLPRLLLVLASSSALAACGTTVSVTGAAGEQVSGGLAAPASGSDATTPGRSDLSFTGAGTTASSGGIGTPGGAIGGSAPGTSTAAPTPVHGAPLSTQHAPGVTAKTIEIGFPYPVNGAALNNSAGGAGITQGDEKGEAQTVINDINAHGGILGRKVVPVWHQYDALSNQSIDSIYQSICADFTQDHHVYAIMFGGYELLENCAQQAGAVQVYENLSSSSSQTFRKYPAYAEPSMLDLDRIVLNEATALSAQGYFAPWDTINGKPAATGHGKVGIIGYDLPDYHYAIDKVLRPELSRLHQSAAAQDTVYEAFPQHTSDLSQLSAQMANAVVRFRQDGVDHVLIVDVDGTLTLEFLNQAESQQYHPRYGWSSQNGPEALAGPGDVTPDQLAGSMGIGWFPVLDLTPQDNPDNGPYSNSSRRACLKLLTSHSFTFSDANAKIVGLVVCDEFHFLERAVEAGGPNITQASFVAGVNSLGSSFESGHTFSTYFSPAQHDGGGGYRYYQWQTGCGCMRYTSGVKAAIGEGIR